jgi:putative oxidoreductase
MLIIKKLLQIGAREEYVNILVLILRVAIAAFMLTHGLPKLSRLLEGGEIQFGDPIGLGPALSLILVVFSEFVCSILVGIGLGTRLAVIPLMITMIVAAFVAHSADPFGRKEIALLYLLFYITLFVLGSGKYSIDYLLTRRRAGSG